VIKRILADLNLIRFWGLRFGGSVVDCSVLVRILLSMFDLDLLWRRSRSSVVFSCNSNPKPKNQYYNRIKPHGPARYGPSPSKDFRAINCRTFQSGTGSQSDSKTLGKSTPIAINVKSSKKEKPFNGSFSFSELWAGPAYSNSPPPSSLPIPKFSIRPKRTVSLELPSSASDMEMHPTHPIAKSAPASPTREHSSSARDLFHNADSATRTLRRILNLDVDDE
ncbi:unnamed protein product, partial [Prunus brigantina]